MLGSQEFKHNCLSGHNSTTNHECFTGALFADAPTCPPQNVWAYDKETGLCSEVVYRGCEGNDNRYRID